MKLGFKIVGAKTLFNKFKKYGAIAADTTASTLYTEAEAIIADAKENYVPVVTGALRGSGFVEPPKISGGKMTVTLGFGGPAAKYALIVHENPRAGKTKGKSPSGAKYKKYSKVGQWKYLETPFNKRVKGVGPKIGTNIKEATRGLKK